MELFEPPPSFPINPAFLEKRNKLQEMEVEIKVYERARDEAYKTLESTQETLRKKLKTENPESDEDEIEEEVMESRDTVALMETWGRLDEKVNFMRRILELEKRLLSYEQHMVLAQEALTGR